MFKCMMCGKCCREIPIDVVASDIVRWYNEGRIDILKQVGYINNYPKTGIGGFYIVKTALSPKQDCPFLKDNRCSIHDTKPFVCKNAPLAHTEFKTCLHFEPESDEVRTKHLLLEREEFRETYVNKHELLKLLVEVRAPCQV